MSTQHRYKAGQITSYMSYQSGDHVESGDSNGRVDQEIDGLLEGRVVLGCDVVAVKEQKVQQKREKQFWKQLKT